MIDSRGKEFVMKEKRNSILILIAVGVSILALCGITLIGIGKGHRGSSKNIHLGLDLAGGVSITYQAVGKTPTNEQMQDTVYKIQQRVQDMNTESAVYQEGKDRINVDIPGVTNANEILEKLGKAGAIQFLDESGKVVLDGSDIAKAEAALRRDENGVGKQSVVNLTLNAVGKKKFAKATRENIGKRIAIVYDGKTIQSPVVQSEITEGQAQISGQTSFEEAQHLASTIRIGALPVQLKELRSNIVGAKLGAEAVSTSLWAGAIGFLLVMIFMIVFYRLPGVASAFALMIYVGMMLVSLNVLNLTLTLPGIAGIILSIGMAVDANVIIFTRIKEEIASGKAVRSAIQLGFEKALSAIIDGNVTTLIAAVVLWVKGSGTVKGFAQTLALGIVLSMFMALVVTRLILQAFYTLGLQKETFYGIQKERKPFDFIKHTTIFYAISAAIVCIGIGSMWINKTQIGNFFNYGLDFKGGTSTSVTFKGKVPSNKELEQFVYHWIKDSGIEVAPVANSKTVLIKTKELTLKQRETLQKQFVKKYGVDKQKITTENISGAVSKEMKMDAVVSLIIAMICMLLYIWFRFKDIKFGAGAVLGLTHDIIAVVAIYAVSRIAIGNTFIACILTIVGYSINSTIIIFDRIRENLGKRTKKQDLKEIVNASIMQTLSRSINTSLTTFIMVFVLYIIGVESIKDFALPLMGGIVIGAYSSICIAGTTWHLLKTKCILKKQ